jgi:ABC-type branched-subunit amino acid transport system substrate-binding protein
MRGSRLAVALLVAVAAAACGTTVPLSQQAQTGAGSSGLTGGAPAAGDTPGSTSGDLAGTATTGSSPGGSTVAGTSGGSGAGSSATGSTTGGATGVRGPGTTGVTARTPIKIGVLTATGAAKYQRSLGFSKGASGDQVAMTQSVVSWINAHGGLAGRPIQLVSYDLDYGAAATDLSSAMQAACTFFTQDNRVVAVASYIALAPDSFYACMAKAHVPLVNPDEGVSSDFFKRYANTVYVPSGPSYTRLLADSVDALWNAGWLTATSVVGVVGYDTNDVHSIVDKGLVPALQRHGLKLTTGFYTSTDTDAAGQYGGGVLSFKAKNVDRVFFAPGGQPIYFGLAAEQQAYHPHYEMGSLEYPNPVAQTLPADQLAGSMGLGWMPYLDLPSSEWPKVVTPGIALCRKAMAAAKQDYSGSTTLAIAAWVCDDWLFLRDVFAAGATPDEAGIRRAADSLGATFRPAATFRSLLGPDRTHDGAAGYRLLAFSSACTCYRYTSPVRSLP